jgi:maltose O-acetyltransferase
MRGAAAGALRRLRGEQDLGRLCRAGLRLGERVRIEERTVIDPRFPWAVTIGDDAIIAHDVRIIAHDAAARRLIGYTRLEPVTIGERCYIGAGALVLPGSTIGDDSVIGAGSVVRGAIPPGVVAAGTPARVLHTVEEFRERTAADALDAPRYEAMGRELSPAQREEIAGHLARTGRVYIR